jgi:hypothetical protein
MKPEIQQLLRNAGVIPESRTLGSNENSLTDKLDAAGLSLEETLDELANLAKRSGNEGIRLRALESSLKAHGALKETTPPIPSFTIIIQPSSSSTPQQQSSFIPPGVNPILLPRQLLTQLVELESTSTDKVS